MGAYTQAQVHLWWSPDGVNMYPVTDSNPLPVTVVSSTPSTANIVNGSASTTTNNSINLIPAVTGEAIHVMALTFSNSSGTPVTVSLQDGSLGTTIWSALVPAGGNYTISGGAVPLCSTSVGNGLYFQSSIGETTVYANAAGFSE